jgi:hypothetical protein
MTQGRTSRSPVVGVLAAGPSGCAFGGAPAAAGERVTRGPQGPQPKGGSRVA